jgi:hypothetical protein
MALTRRSLEDLWNTGKEYDISPSRDGSATVFVRKLGPAQQSQAVRMANADRSKLIVSLKDKESERYLAAYAEALLLERDAKIEQLAQTEIAESRDKIEQEISENSEWADEEYLQSLIDSWENGLLEEWLKGEGNRSEESERVWSEIQRFNEEISKKLEGHLKRAKASIEHLEDEELNERVAKAEIEYEASVAWMRTFRLYQIMFGVQTVEREQMFDDIKQVASLPAELFARLVECITELNTPSVEVKS